MIAYLIGFFVTLVIVMVARVRHYKPRRGSEWAEMVIFALVLACVWPIAAGCGLYHDVRHPWR